MRPTAVLLLHPSALRGSLARLICLLGLAMAMALGLGLAACGSDSAAGSSDDAQMPPDSGNGRWSEVPLTATSLPPVQINVYSGAHAWPYANVLRSSEAWVSSASAQSAEQARGLAASLEIRPDGWPAGLPAGAQLQLSIAGYPSGMDSAGVATYLHGVWVLTWEGSGELELQTSENNGLGETLLLDDRANGRIIKLITDRHKYPTVFVRSSAAADPVRNVKLWAPVRDGAGLDLTPASELGRGRVAGSLEPLPGVTEPVFHPTFLNHLHEAGSGIALRTMGFLRINQDASAWGSTPLEWSDRGNAAYALGSLSVIDSSWSRHEVAGYRQKLGVPYEWLIELANETANDLWIQVPHTASEDLIRQLARLIAGKNGHVGLHKNLRVWFEFSNEIWNGASSYKPQYDHATAAAAAHFGVPESEVTDSQRGWGSGHVQGLALAAFQDEWKRAGGTDDRLINVVAGFAMGTGFNTAALAAVKEIDPNLPEVLAISNYFGHSASGEIHNLTDWAATDGSTWSDALVEQAESAVRRNLYATQSSWQANAQVAAAAGVHMVSYEGGQHLLAVGLGDGADPVFRKFMNFLEFLQRGSVMKRLYTEHYALWSAAGGRTASLFTDIGPVSYWGYWGAKEWITDTRATSSKWDAFVSWVEGMQGVRALNEPVNQAPTLVEQSLHGEAGQPLAATLQASGGDGAVKVQLIGGALPPGLAFTPGSQGSATLSGTPTASSTTTLVLRAVDADGDAAYRSYTLAIDPAGSSSSAILRFDASALLATQQASGAFNGRYDPVRAYDFLGSSQEKMCVPFSTADGSALFDREYDDGATLGTNRIAASSPNNVYGGWCVTQQQVVGSACQSSWTGLRGGELVSWSGANCSGTGHPTALDMFLVWRREQFANAATTGRFAFGATDATSTLRVDFTQVIQDGDNEFRFAVLDGGTWYLSEASYTQQVVGAGFLEVTGFNGSSVPGRRWAVVTPTAYNFAIPAAASLSFAAHSFSDVRAVAVVYHGRRWGYHYNVAIKRFLVLGRQDAGS